MYRDEPDWEPEDNYDYEEDYFDDEEESGQEYYDEHLCQRCGSLDAGRKFGLVICDQCLERMALADMVLAFLFGRWP